MLVDEVYPPWGQKRPRAALGGAKAAKYTILGHFTPPKAKLQRPAEKN
jgi:hypothetical protein